MNLFSFRPGYESFLPSLLALLLLSSCVKQSEYDLVVSQNKDLEDRLGRKVSELQQANAQVQAQHARLLQLINVQSTLQKRDEELLQTREELEALRAEFDKFRVQRRSAMLGKKMPFLQLDNGKTLKDVEVTSIGAMEVTLRHEGGLIKMALADTNDDFRWEACYDTAYAQAQERSRFLADAQRMEVMLTEARLKPAVDKKPVETDSAQARRASGQQLTALITAQRNELNREFAALKSRNPGLKDVTWNNTYPEASPMLNDFDSRRAVLGLSRLEMIRDIINDNLARLRELNRQAR